MGGQWLGQKLSGRGDCAWSQAAGERAVSEHWSAGGRAASGQEAAAGRRAVAAPLGGAARGQERNLGRGHGAGLRLPISILTRPHSIHQVV